MSKTETGSRKLWIVEQFKAASHVALFASAALAVPQLTLAERAQAAMVEVNDRGLLTGAIYASNQAYGEPMDLDAIIAEIHATGSPAPTKLVGDLAQTSVGTTLAITGTTTSTATAVTACSSTASIAVGNPVTGTGIPANATVAAVGTAASITGTTSSSSTSITGVSSTVGLIVGQSLTGTGIPAGATISGLTSNTITLSAAATAAGTITITVNADAFTLSAAASASGTGTAISVLTEVQVIGLSEWGIDFKQKTADATTTDDSEWESSLPSTKSWSATAKFMFIDGDPSQSTYILAAVSSITSPKPWNFFPTVAVGRQAFQGNAYVTGIKITSGMGKIVGLDVTLQGTGPLKPVIQLASVANTNTVTGQQAEA